MQSSVSSAKANANIALIKYWGKACPKLNIPAVSSLSMTLDGLSTTVSIKKSEKLTVAINGSLAPDPVKERVFRFLESAHKHYAFDNSFTINSKSSIPFAAGLASSAAFYAALACALNHHEGWNLSQKELSTLARLGSASAARSIYAGFSGLYGTKLRSHEQSFAFPIHAHPDLDLCMIVAIVDTEPKAISSRQAMVISQSTSPFFTPFVKHQEKDFSKALAAIRQGSFSELGAVMEHSTLKMFATMWTAQPAINYWQQQSLGLINLIYRIRQEFGPIAYFTMDAGPQVKVLCQAHSAPLIEEKINNSGLTQKIVTMKPGAGSTIIDEHLL